jgi:hypothetical protein
MSVNPEKPAGYDSDGKPYYKEDNSNEGLATAETLLPPPPPVPTTPAPPLTTEITNAVEPAITSPVVEAAAPTTNLSNEINLNISAMIQPNKPAKIGEIKTNEHSLKFSPEIDLVNPTEALDRLSSGINQTIKATSADPLILNEAYTPPEQQPTRWQRFKNVITRKNKVAPAPQNSVTSPIQTSEGGRRVHTKKNNKRRITKSNRKKVRPSRRR